MPGKSNSCCTNSRGNMSTYQSWIPRSRDDSTGGFRRARNRRHITCAKGGRNVVSPKKPSRVGWRKWEWPMKRITLLLTFLCLGLSGFAGEPFKLSWTNNLLTVTSSDLPGGKLEIWYLEAFCRTGSTHQDWGKTTLPHRTALLQAEPKHLRFKTKVQPDVEVNHEVFAHNDELEFTFQFKNLGTSALDIDWSQPACIRVAAFTGSDQTNYNSKSFIFTKSGLTTLNATGRREEAI